MPEAEPNNGTKVNIETGSNDGLLAVRALIRIAQSLVSKLPDFSSI